MMADNLKLNKYKFFPKSNETLVSHSSQETVTELLRRVPNPKNMIGRKVWGASNVTDSSAGLRLKAFNLYGLPPNILIEKVEKKLTVKISFDKLSRMILRIWLWFCIVSYSAFLLYMLWEYTLGDGLTSLTLNGQISLVSVIPWVPLFLIIHSLVFFFYPAIVISLGWRRSKKLAEDILGVRNEKGSE